ncbi:hypothetical protein BGW36DRAFT_392750 [Talaromyces proteolyticus]|uniref:Uncharacterized protein n=1 Tax=Talaromyces proteolyticus TaxID=1131652 RepID=A0AAD4L012_9EURO|nr:uncharacterized protein BGW36DRAFT_392750 [Talaromyces proteolyticus]KAH8705032.1 hypothetical protein BGW36DRAFT_392750 [Talaromyces proteolyticus]
MITVSAVEASNTLIKSSLPSRLVAVFIGATSGIGESSLIHFAKYASLPRIHFVGRSQNAADTITKRLHGVNPEGEYHFIKADVSLLKRVDEVCKQIAEKENISMSYFRARAPQNNNTETVTTENLNLIQALSYYSRMRFIVNLLPFLREGPSLRRVITVLAGTKEGPINPQDAAGQKVAPWNARGHACSVMTLTLEEIATQAPEISFIHDYPGYVKTPIGRTMKGLSGAVMKAYLPWLPLGQRHVFLATSSRYPSKKGKLDGSQNGIPLVKGLEVAVGADGETGSGVYSVGAYGETGDVPCLRVLAQLRQGGIRDKVWQHLQDEFLRITGRTTV